MKYKKYLIPFVIILLSGCQILPNRDYEELPSMLTVLTIKAQGALEQGYFGDEQTARDHVRSKNPEVWEWFDKNGYELRMGKVGDYAVVTVCDKNRPIFEDTFCKAGYPDKDHRKDHDTKSCGLTMTVEEVDGICRIE